MFRFAGEKLRALRLKHGYSMTDLEKYTGIDQTTISDLENGKTKFPRTETVEKLARFFGVPEKDFYTTDSVPISELTPEKFPRYIKEFIAREENLPWLALSEKAKRSGIPIEILEQIIELLSRKKGRKKRNADQ